MDDQIPFKKALTRPILNPLSLICWIIAASIYAWWHEIHPVSLLIGSLGSIIPAVVLYVIIRAFINDKDAWRDKDKDSY